MQAVASWIQKVEASEYRPLLSGLFERYVDATLEYCRRNFVQVVNQPGITQVQTVCKILEGFLPQVRLLLLASFQIFRKM
jgi:dynein heavy chain